jgi:hypothetical protein
MTSAAGFAALSMPIAWDLGDWRGLSREFSRYAATVAGPGTVGRVWAEVLRDEGERS